MSALRITGLTLAVLLWCVVLPARALVNYEAGRLELNGVLLLQDSGDANAYYYLPPTPRVAQRRDGGIEISVVKFVDPNGETSGGLLHLLVTFTLPPEDLAALQTALKQARPGARLMGPVPMRQEDEGSFTIVSAVLTDKGLTRSLISSGRAPLTPGAKAAVASTLSPQGATLLWESLSRPTSDVSVAVQAYYEAVLPSFRAKVSADVSTVYEHFSRLHNVQHQYTRRQVRDIVDELTRTGAVNIEVLDRLPEDAGNKAMQSLVDLVSQKLTEVIFNQSTGFTAIPKKEVAVQKGQVKGRQKRGWLARVFRSTGNQKYYTDNQYVLKDRRDINQAKFNINLTRRAVVKVPVATAGNLSGLYEVFKDDPAMFRVVNLADPAFQKRDVYFRIDGDFSSAFEKIMNFSGVTLRKHYTNHEDATGELIFTREDVREGRLSKSWPYARLGEKGAEWLDYEYQVTWSLHGRREVKHPREKDAWLKSNDPIVTLAPPLGRLDLEVDADRFLFEDEGIRSATLEIRCSVFGRPKTERLAVMRATDADSLSRHVVFHDPHSRVDYRVNWYPSGGKPIKGQWKKLEDSYLVLAPPE